MTASLKQKRPRGGLRIDARPEGLGAAVTGLDLSRPLSTNDLQAVLDAFAAHAVLWFPDQPLTHDQLEAFSLQIGPFGWDPYVEPLADRPHIVEVRRDASETALPFGGGWHSDWSFQETPPSASLLHAKVVPPVGGETLFADGAAAYDALSPVMQGLLTGLRAVHSAAGPYGAEGFFAKETEARAMRIIVSPEADKTHSHPLVRTHPVSGRRSLFVSPGYTVGIEGMSADESAALLGYLYGFMTGDRFVYRHRWAPDMLTMWDNRRLLHCATGGYDGHLRIMHRTTIAGARPQ